MATKFHIFRRSIAANPEKVTRITKATCCLHNYMKITEASNAPSSRHYRPPAYSDREDRSGNLVPGDWRNVAAEALQGRNRIGINSYSQSAAHLRDAIKDDFLTPQGAVPWQIDHVRSSGRSS